MEQLTSIGDLVRQYRLWIVFCPMAFMGGLLLFRSGIYFGSSDWSRTINHGYNGMGPFHTRTEYVEEKDVIRENKAWRLFCWGVPFFILGVMILPLWAWWLRLIAMPLLGLTLLLLGIATGRSVYSSKARENYNKRIQDEFQDTRNRIVGAILSELTHVVGPEAFAEAINELTDAQRNDFMTAVNNVASFGHDEPDLNAFARRSAEGLSETLKNYLLRPAT